MKTKFIKEPVFGTYIELFWDCTEQEFCDKHNKNSDFKIYPTTGFGKCVHTENSKEVDVRIWINRKDNIETLSHEILHAVRFWLQDFQHIPLCKETEEVYANFHSFFMQECLKALGHKKLTAGM